ncbi:MAG: hypothetical protein JWR60_1226, partial [Polaromonas sp.]|nr:hypothetical protein [Polaromonas sp.]
MKSACASKHPRTLGQRLPALQGSRLPANPVHEFIWRNNAIT